MNWEMISAVGQMLGAIGVIISIIYLAAQIRNQNKESQRAAMNVLTSHWSDLNRTLAENPDMAALWLRALQSFDELDGPAIILAGSGMATGGRVLHHLRRRLGDERTTVLLAGYQAAGTRGRLLRDGATTLRIFGEEIPVRAKILATDALSAHADQREILRWLRQLARPPQATWAVHGEPDAAAALRDAIARDLGWRVAVAADGQRVAV